jgi:hypothetical protein
LARVACRPLLRFVPGESDGDVGEHFCNPVAKQERLDGRPRAPRPFPSGREADVVGDCWFDAKEQPPTSRERRASWWRCGPICRSFPRHGQTNGRSWPQRRGDLRRRLIQQRGGALVARLICAVIWLATGAHGMFWPVWVVLVAPLPLLCNAGVGTGPALELDRVE